MIFSVLATMEFRPLQRDGASTGYFAKLCREIISQQLGSKAARVVSGRFLDLFPKQRITPELILAFPEKGLRASGMSWAKARYIKDLAEKTLDGDIKFKELSHADDETIIRELTKVKGIGRWTAEMFLIFTLGREDIFSFGDLGLRKSFEGLYGKRRARTQKSMEAVTRRWSPYRSYASLALWHLRDSMMAK